MVKDFWSVPKTIKKKLVVWTGWTSTCQRTCHHGNQYPSALLTAHWHVPEVHLTLIIREHEINLGFMLDRLTLWLAYLCDVNFVFKLAQKGVANFNKENRNALFLL